MSHRPPTPDAVKQRLRYDFQNVLGLNRKTAEDIVAGAVLLDKAYELSAMLDMMRSIRAFRPTLTFQLRNGSAVGFQRHRGPIVRTATSHVAILENGGVVGEIWTDVECVAISAPTSAKFHLGHIFGMGHELDIVVVKPRTNGRPLPNEILLAAEAKNRSFSKELLKQILGVRREMTMRRSHRPRSPRHWFAWWTPRLPANPPSGLIAYCSYPNIANYGGPANYWGIHMKHLPF